MDTYIALRDKISKYKNPVNDIEVIKVYGIDDPKFIIKNNDIKYKSIQ